MKIPRFSRKWKFVARPASERLSVMVTASCGEQWAKQLFEGSKQALETLTLGERAVGNHFRG